jgi:uncharacterized protein YjbI with pentapeptide repeats
MKTSSPQAIQQPRIPKQLPVRPLAALEDDGEYALFELSGCNLADTKASQPVFEQMLFHRVVLGPSRHKKPRFVDCRLETSDLSRIEWEGARFRRVEFIGCRMIGSHLMDSEMEDVTLKECNLERAIFLSAGFKAVRFIHCVLREASFEKADLSGVVFDDCDLTDADLRQSKLNRTDFRGSMLGGIQVGTQELKGAIVESAQAIQMAGLIGLIVREKGEDLNIDYNTE